MKKIVQINVSNYGSTGTIMKQIHQNGIENGFEMYAFYGRGKESNIKNIIKFSNKIDNYIHYAISYLFDLEGFGSYFNTKKLIKKINKIDPDIIHLHNIHGHYINIKVLFNYLSKSNKKVIWTLHDCWSFTGHCAYFDLAKCENWKHGCGNCKQRKEYPKTIFIDKTQKNYNRKKELFAKLKPENLTFVTPSKWLADLINESYLSKYKVEVINNDIDKNTFKPQKNDFRKKYNLKNKYIILGVANKWDERKGLKYFIELNEKLSEKYQIILVGLTKKQIEEIPNNILCFEKTSSKEELAEIYSTADVFLNPTLEDNYPTVNLEAQACGTPVITFNTGGSPETIVNGYTVEKNDIETIIKLFEKTRKNINTDKIKDDNYKQYFKLYDNNIDKKKKVFWLTNVPAPYRIDFFNEFGKLVNLTVLFERAESSERDKSWKQFKSKNFDFKILKGINICKDLSFNPKIIKEIKQKNYDYHIVTNISSPTEIILITYMIIKKIKYIIEIDGGFAKNGKGIKEKIKKFLISNADLYFSTSNEANNYLITYGAKKEKIIKYPFTSLKENDILKKLPSNQEKKEIKKELGIKEDKIIVSVGRFIYSKGFDILLLACKNLKNSGIYIIGGKENGEYSKIIKENNIKNVHFIDFMDKEQLNNYYKCADLFVLPTRSDVWGLVINEAQAKGLPVITTNMCIAGLEIIKNGENGYIIENENIQQLEEKIIYLLNNKNELKRMSENSINLIKDYTFENMAKIHYETLKKMEEYK